MSISNNYPNVRPSLLLDFANTKTLDPRITFTRASTATYYDGKTVAKAEENLLERSQEFDNVYWNKNNSSIIANSTTAPDGTTTADSLVEDSANNIHYLQRGGSFTTTSGQVYAFSVYAKANTRTWLYMEIYDSANYQAYFNLSTGVTGTVSGGITATITSVGNGWYRCSIVRTVSTGAISPNFGLASADNTRSYLGNGASSIFIWGAQLEQRSSVTAYTPTTTAPITNYIPALQTAASGVARFDHNPTTGESLGLLIEESRTNLVTYSEQFDNAAWTKSASSISSNVIVAPDGTLTGDKLVENTANAEHTLQISVGNFASVPTYSVYLKRGERNWALIFGFGAGPNNFTVAPSAYFDLANGVIGTTNQCTASITNVGNGWYRCSVTSSAVIPNTSSSMNWQVRTSTGNGVGSYTGDGWSGIYVWGAQLEAGSFATSYIPTTSATVTRSTDSASMTGTNFSSWYRADEGTWYGEASTVSTATNGRLLSASAVFNSFDPVYSINFESNGQTRIYQVVNGSSTYDFRPSNYTVNTPVKLSGTYRVGSYAGVSNGGTVSTSSSQIRLPLLSYLQIGALPNASSFVLNGTIKKIAYYPARLTNAELQGLTTI